MALRSLSRKLPGSLLRQASAPRMGPLREVSPASGGRFMGTRRHEKETQEMIASTRKATKEMQAAARNGHLLLRQEFTEFQEKTSRDLDQLMKYANMLSKAANVSLGVAIIGVSGLLIMGSKDQA